MKRKLFVGLVTGLFIVGMVGGVSADIIETVHLDFQSGATWDGTITFNDNYAGMIDTDGYLSGGTYSYNDIYFSWTWWEGSNQPHPYYDFDGNMHDLLMSGPEPSWTSFLGITWDADASMLSGGVSIVTDINDNYWKSYSSTGDQIVGYQVGPNPVPEPATMLLFGSGIAGLIGTRMRKKKK